MNKLVQAIEAKYKKKKVPFFRVGDTVKVHTKIIEGEKTRVQIFNGVVVGRKGSGISETFTVNRVAFGYANAKVFMMHSASVVDVEVVQRGDVRQAKLNYIRGKLGKKAKVKTKIGGKMDLYAANNAVEEEVVQEEASSSEASPESETSESSSES